MNVGSLLLTMRQLKEVYDKGEKPVPYVVKHKRSDQQVVFVASNHTSDPSNPNFDVLRKLWQQFLKETEGQSRLALNEGGLRPLLPTEVEAIQTQSEAGLLTLMANKAGVPIESPEPSNYAEAAAIKKDFSPEILVYYYFARQIPQWNRTPNRPEFKVYMNNFLEHLKIKLGWDLDFSLENMLRIHQKTFKMPFDETDSEFFHNQSDPTQEETVIQAVSRACNVARDEHFASEVVKHWQKGKSMFCVYGSAHVYTLEPLLLQLDKF